MEKYEKSSSLKSNVTTSPSNSPVLSRRLSQNPLIAFKREQPDSTFQRSNREKEIYRLGKKLIDMGLSCQYLNKEDKLFLEELNDRNLEAYIYSAIPGSLHQHCPLVRSIKGDPADATYACVVTDYTTVFFPKADAANQVYFEELDIENFPALSNGIIYSSLTDSGNSKELPLGRGTAILSAAKNWLRNSLFEDYATAIIYWTLSGYGGSDTDRKRDEGWMGVPSLWLSSTGENWSSSLVDISGTAAGDSIAFSFGWRTDGNLRVKLSFYDGATYHYEYVNVDKGSGYYQGTFDIPVGYGGIGDSLDLDFYLTSGTYGEFCAPQVVLGYTTYNGCEMYPVFIGNNDISGVYGQITSMSLRYEGDWTASMWRSAGDFGDSVLCVSGFVQPMVTELLMTAPRKLFSLVNQSGKELECHLRTSGGALYMILICDGVTYGTTAVPNFEYGDTIFVALLTGWKNGTSVKKLIMRVVGDTTSYIAEDNTATDLFSFFQTLFIGTNESGTQGADCLFQDINIWSGTEDMVDDMVAYMADPDNLEEHMDTIGRKYRINPSLNPDRFNDNVFNGTLECENTKVL